MCWQRQHAPIKTSSADDRRQITVVVLLEPYADRLAAGGINPNPSISTERVGPSIAVVDADYGLGQSAAIEAVDVAQFRPLRRRASVRPPVVGKR